MTIHQFLWYNQPLDRVLKHFKTSAAGLSEAEAKERLAWFGDNKLPQKKRINGLLIFIRQFQSILVLILLAAAGAAIGLGEVVDFFVIMAAILINVIVGFVQEYRAERELEKLNDIVRYQAKVYRDGLLKVIPAEQLAPGDIVLLEPGDQVPADIRLMNVNDLSISESVLTGESSPVIKTSKCLSVEPTKEFLVADRRNMAFYGTVVADGKATGIVTAVGRATEIGKIAQLLAATKNDDTPLQAKLKKFSRNLGLIILALCSGIIGLGLLKGMPFWDIFLISMATAVAAVPEGLLVAVTVILAIGMRRILKKKALVRQLLAAETLGSTSVVCVDKTGTITEGNMVVQAAMIPGQDVNFGRGLEPIGACKEFVVASLLVNNAVMNNGDDDIIGSPTEKAILTGSYKFKWDRRELNSYQRRREIPFTSKSKIMYTLNQANEHDYLWCAKGAPEVVLDKCAYYLEQGRTKRLTAKAREEWLSKFARFSNQGSRILAVAFQPVKKPALENYQASQYIFLGFWVIDDPIRPGIKSTIKLAQRAGIRVIMITGDHRNTAAEIARRIGLTVGKKSIMDGQELMSLTNAELKQRVKTVSVFARVSPEDKLKIVNALQELGEVVAMTGDGVNDAPALKIADIGIAVASGTDVTKQTADMVLLDNNFKTIIAAVEQGRIIYMNIKKVIVYLMADAFGALVLVLGSLLFGLPLPITAAQILWVNLISDGFPAAALTVEGREAGLMAQKPIKESAKILDAEMKVLTLVIGIFSALVLFAVFVWLNQFNFDLPYLRTIVFAGLGLNTLFYVFSVKSLVQPIWKINIFSNKYLLWAVLGGLILQLLPIYVPALREIFNLVRLGAPEWGLVICLSLLQMALIEITKYFYSHRKQT